MAADSWAWLADQYDYVELDHWVVMPNHIHGIIVVGATLAKRPVGVVALDTDASQKGAGTRPAPTKNPTLGDIVGAFKSITTHEYILGVDNQHWPQFYKRLWQRNYYEHVVRDEKDLNRIRDYIQSNPANWDEDEENPKFVKP